MSIRIRSPSALWPALNSLSKVEETYIENPFCCPPICDCPTGSECSHANLLWSKLPCDSGNRIRFPFSGRRKTWGSLQRYGRVERRNHLLRAFFGAVQPSWTDVFLQSEDQGNHAHRQFERCCRPRQHQGSCPGKKSRELCPG